MGAKKSESLMRKTLTCDTREHNRCIGKVLAVLATLSCYHRRCRCHGQGRNNRFGAILCVIFVVATKRYHGTFLGYPAERQLWILAEAVCYVYLPSMLAGDGAFVIGHVFARSDVPLLKGIENYSTAFRGM